MIDGRIESILKNVTKDIKSIRDEYELDNIHNKKRVGSFLLLDIVIERCAKNECPSFDDDALYLLSDISVDEYVKIKKYHLGQQDIGADDKQRKELCLERIDRIVNCNQKPNLDLNLFEKDINVHVSNNDLSDSIINRKAYWTFEKFKPLNDPKTDFEGACGFVNEINKAYKNIKSDVEINKLKGFYGNHWECPQNCVN